ncbi:MAG: hypothetical protein CL878_04765 [Dehalococcoidia bacterium]|nr:hypothetical protein [Dehalococcoidia bacterium]
MNRPRVGHIQYLNCLPLYHGLVRHDVLLDIELHKGTPTELNHLLTTGQLDVSPISSIEYLRHADELVLLPDLTVSSDGEVKSIVLVSKVPASELDGRTVALANTSATSQVLTQILLVDRYSANPAYFACPPDLGRMLDEADAALLIGDPALRVYLRPPAGLHLYDLGKEWKKLTGHPMVYAVWAVRRSFAETAPPLVNTVYRAFQQSLAYSLANVEAIAADAARWEPFSAAVLAAYFRTLRFTFEPAYQDGLQEYAQHAQALGALDPVPPLEFAVVAEEPADQHGAG